MARLAGNLPCGLNLSLTMGARETLMTADERAIRLVVETWMTASKSGDVSTVVNLMTDDVTFIVPGEEPFGKEAFAAAAKGIGQMKMEALADPGTAGPWPVGFHTQSHRNNADLA